MVELGIKKTRQQTEKLALKAQVLVHILELTPKKDVFFIIGNWNAKVGSQAVDRFDRGVQNEAGQRLTEFCQKNMLVIANTLFQQHKRRLYTWTSPDGSEWEDKVGTLTLKLLYLTYLRELRHMT